MSSKARRLFALEPSERPIDVAPPHDGGSAADPKDVVRGGSARFGDLLYVFSVGHRSLEVVDVENAVLLARQPPAKGREQ